jgi:large subunit ribosomal protein L24e
MVIKTELCAFSEWKIYPGRGIRYVAKDGRPFLYLSKRTKDFGLRYHYSLMQKAQSPKT